MSTRIALIAASAFAALAQAMKANRLRPGRALPQSRPDGDKRAPMRRRRQMERGQLKAGNGLAR